MATPTERELRAVEQNVHELTIQQNQILKNILKLLGVGKSHLVAILETNDDDARSLLSGEEIFTGRDLSRLCKVFAFRPGIVQSKYNFDRTESGAQGKKKWTGPHPIFTEGDNRVGSHLKRVVDTLSSNCGLTTEQLRQVGSGKRPVTLDVLRCVVAEGQKARFKGGQLKSLEKILDERIPEGIKTVTDLRVTKTSQAAHAAKLGDKDMDTPAIDWADNDQAVTIADTTHILQAGPGMARVGDHIEAAIKRDPGANIKSVMEVAGKGFRWLNAVRKGNQTFTRTELESIAQVLGLPVDILFTGEGLSSFLPTPIAGRETKVVAGSPVPVDQLQEYFKGRVLRKDVKPAEGIELQQIFELALDRDNPEVNWMDAWLGLTAEGVKFAKDASAAKTAMREFGPEARALFIQLVFGDDEQSQE